MPSPSTISSQPTAAPTIQHALAEEAGPSLDESADVSITVEASSAAALPIVLDTTRPNHLLAIARKLDVQPSSAALACVQAFFIYIGGHHEAEVGAWWCVGAREWESGCWLQLCYDDFMMTHWVPLNGSLELNCNVVVVVVDDFDSLRKWPRIG